MGSLDPTQRFSSRVDNYVRYRPRYPEAILQILREECGLTSSAVIADLGSGTGFLSELFLKNGNTVLGVEPNGPMREAGERVLAGYPDFHSIAGTAEATTLSPGSVDFVTAGQALHWFNAEAARVESLRILRPRGWAVVVWNDRKNDATPALQAYEKVLLRYANDYAAVDHKNVGEDRLRDFFGPAGYQHRIVPNSQSFDFEGFVGRVFSSSYSPEPGQSNYAPMVDALRACFDQYNEGGRIEFLYDTLLYFGRLRSA